MDLAKAAAHLILHLRDLERGWTYDHDCKRIRMTIDLFEARSKYLVKICEKQGGSDCERIEELVEYVLDNMALPDWAEKIAEGKIVRHAALF
jgi:acetoacetate decarboxylase